MLLDLSMALRPWTALKKMVKKHGCSLNFQPKVYRSFGAKSVLVKVVAINFELKLFIKIGPYYARPFFLPV